MTTAALPPAIRIHGLADARSAATAARELDRPLTLLADGAAGAAWLMAIVARLASDHPALPVTGLLDCGDRAGEAQGALAAGMGAILFTGAPGVAARLADIAAARGAALLTVPPPSLDLRGQRDPVATCRLWLSAPSL